MLELCLRSSLQSLSPAFRKLPDIPPTLQLLPDLFYFPPSPPKKKKTNKNYAQITDISSQLCSPLSTAPAQCPCQAATVWTFPPMMHSRLLQSQHVFTESSWCSRTPHHKPQPYTEIIPPSKKDKTLRQKAECRRYPPSAMLRGCTRRTHEDLFTQANKSPNKAILCHYSAQNLNLNQINSKA